MESRFECINNVKDGHFRKAFPTLYEKCTALEKMAKEFPSACCKEARTLNESLLIYLFNRVMGEEQVYNRGMDDEQIKLSAYSIINNNEFKARLRNDTFLTLADRVRYDGNKNVHQDEFGVSYVDDELSAESMLLNFSLVVGSFCKMVEKLPEPVKPRLRCKVVIEMREDKTAAGRIHRYLLASVEDANIDKDKLDFKWCYPGRDNKKLNKKNSNMYTLPPTARGQAYICIVTSEEREGERVSNVFKYNAPEKASDVSKAVEQGEHLEVVESAQAKDSKTAKQGNAKKAAENVRAEAPKVVEQVKSRGVAESVPEEPSKAVVVEMQREEKGKIQEFEADKSENEKPPTEPTPGKRDAAVAHGPVTYPLSLPTKLPKLFDSTNGLVHYFVRPNDEFVLNSLEMLDADAYLYRLLKQEGYTRVAFVEVENADCKIYAYDLESESVFKSSKKTPAGQEKKGPQGLMGNRVIQPKAEAKAKQSPLYGKRPAGEFSRAEEFKKKFTAEISNALGGSGSKTAIIMPLSIFEKSGYCGDEVVDTISRIAKSGNHGNILLLTMTRRDDIMNCFSEQSSRIHPWVNSIVNKAGKEAVDRTGEAIRALRARGLIVLADNYETDEIANLLLRKKLLENVEGLADIPTQKVYSLADRLREHCLQIKKFFKEISYQNRSEGCIRQLNALLNEPDVQKELLQMANKIQGTQIGRSNELNPVFLERVYHANINRFEDTNTIESILKEFDSFCGVEMQRAKEEIIGAANEFIRKHRIIQQRIDAGEFVEPGDWPFMTFRFVGPPGTGKTTLADLTARYMHARKILPKTKLTTVNAAQLISSHIGGTAEAIWEVAERADGGVLIIDEFHGFDRPYQGSNIAQEAMNAIVAVLNEQKESLCIIAAGYEEGVNKVLRQDDGANRRFSRTVRFENFSDDTLFAIFKAKSKKNNFSYTGEAEVLIRRIIASDKKRLKDSFGNGGHIDGMLERLSSARQVNPEADEIIEITGADVRAAFPENQELFEDRENAAQRVIEQFSKYTGPEMEAAKQEIIKIVDYYEDRMLKIRERREAGEIVDEEKTPYMNMVFVGPPGVGKTTVANFAAKYMNAKGILPRSDVKEVYASSLIKGVVGETDATINEVAADANGGVLFIDEFQGIEGAYSGGNTAKAAMTALVGVVNKYRDSLCIIIAGYAEEVKNAISFDAGAARRFYNRVEFTNYSLPTLLSILDSCIRDEGMTIEPEARNMLETLIQEEMKTAGEKFGNVGYIKDGLVAKLGKEQLARDRNDSAFRVQDVLAAFPDTDFNGLQEKSAVMRPHNMEQTEVVGLEKEPVPKNYRKLEREIFENLPSPYQMQRLAPVTYAKYVDPAVLYVRTDTGRTGTGFLIHPDGYALTCAHVVRDASKVDVRLREFQGNMDEYTDEWYTCEVINAKEEYDIAVLKLETRGKALRYVPMAKELRRVEKGEEFGISGYPLINGSEDVLMSYTGRISGQTKDAENIDGYFIDGNAKKGNSGSPLLSFEDGCVIGLLMGGIREGSAEDNYMRPIKYFWTEFLR